MNRAVLETARELDARYGVAEAVRFAASRLGGVVAELSHGGARATVALYGAQVLSYVPARGAEVLWLSPDARLDTGKAVRGGIPVCWPWFGPHTSDARLPAHGVVRTATWQVLSTHHDDTTGAGIVLGWRTPDVVPAGLPDPALAAELHVRLDDRLHVSLTTRNGDAAPPVEITSALHSYFRIGDIGAATVTGLDGVDYLDKLDGRAKRQSGAVTFGGEVDRIYRSGARTVVEDPTFGRRIVVEASGSGSTVVWNPWVDKARRLGDLGPDGHERFVCVETANAGEDRRVIPTGGAHRLAAVIAAARP